VWRALRHHLKGHLNCPILLNGIFVGNWQYIPASSASKKGRVVVNTSFFDLDQYKVVPTGNRFFVFDDVDEPSSIMHVARARSCARNLPAIARVEIDDNVFLYVIVYAPTIMNDLIALICTQTKRQVAAYALLPAKPFYQIRRSDTTDVCFPSSALKLNPAASTPKSFSGSDFYYKADTNNSLFVRGGAPTDLVLTNRPSEDFIQLEAIETTDGKGSGVCSTISVWKKAATDDFSVGGKGVESVILFGRSYEDGNAPSPFGSKSRYFDPVHDADLVILSTSAEKEPAADRLDGMLAEASRELSARVAANLRKQEKGRAQAEANRKSKEAEKQAAARKEIEDARLAAEAAEKAREEERERGRQR
jgi:hypothetical protein